ncbi:MAG: hypothetical protein ABWY51_05435 [Gaiellaceae bacterium]
MKRLLIAVVVVLAMAPGAGARPEVSKLLLGITGDPSRFQSQTGQKSAIKHVFLGWQQGMTWGTRIEVFLPQLAPIPMIHLGIGGPGAVRVARITMQQIANGQGDAYLLHLNKAVSEYGSLVYVRPMAEMNSAKALYNSSNGAGFSPQAYRLAFARIYLILHGGPRPAINASLRRLGLPLVGTQQDLPANPKGKLRVIWNPVAGNGGWQGFYPGNRWVDLIGNDMYGLGGDFSRGANEELYAFARAHKKRYSFPEWGIAVDQPEFVRYLCDFIRSRAAIELAAYFDSKAGSKWDLGSKSGSKQTYRSCLTPLELMP